MQCLSVSPLFSERQYTYSCRPGQAADEGAFQTVRRSGGRLRSGPRREDHHLHRPAGVLGHGVLPGGFTHLLFQAPNDKETDNDIC